MYTSLYKKGQVYYIHVRIPAIDPKTGKTLKIKGKYKYSADKHIKTGCTSRGRAITLQEETERQLLGDTDQDHFINEIAKITQQIAPKKRGIDEIWQIYIDTNPECSPPALTSKHRLLQSFLDWLSASHPTLTTISKITPEICDEYADIIKQMPITGKTKTNKIGMLSSIFSTLVVKVHWQENPWKYVKPPTKKDSIPGREFYSDEIPRILQECKKAGGEWYEISLLAAVSYLRYKDLCFLEKNQIQNNIITDRNFKTCRFGTVSIAYIPDNVMEILRPLINTGDSKYLFPTRAERYNISGNKKGTYQHILRAAGVKSDQYGRISFHSWRHTANTNAADDGISLAQRLLSGGWNNEDMQKKIRPLNPRLPRRRPKSRQTHRTIPNRIVRAAFLPPNIISRYSERKEQNNERRYIYPICLHARSTNWKNTNKNAKRK